MFRYSLKGTSKMELLLLMFFAFITKHHVLCGKHNVTDVVRITENGERFSEIITVDTFDRVKIEVETHNHGTFEHVIRTTDTKERLVAYDLPQEKVCSIYRMSDYDAHEMSGKTMRRAIKIIGHKLPPKGSEREVNHLLAGHRCDFKGNPTLKDFARFGCRPGHTWLCNDYHHLKTREEQALALAKDARSDVSKRIVLRQFLACRPESSIEILRCPPSKLQSDCRLKRRACTYLFTCPLKSDGFHCSYQHEFVKLECCDYTCAV